MILYKNHTVIRRMVFPDLTMRNSTQNPKVANFAYGWTNKSTGYTKMTSAKDHETGTL